MDVAYISAELLARQKPTSPIIDGVPVLAGEILSAEERFGEINERLSAYRGAGVPLIWIIEPYQRTVTVLT